MRLLNRSVGLLSRHRRRPLAGLLVVVLGLMLTGGLYAMFSPSSSAQAGANGQQQIAAGRALFLVSCASCHGQNGEGISTTGGQLAGPTLVGVGAAAVDFQVGTGRMPMVQPGAQVQAHRPTFDQTEISELAAYVASLGPGPAIPDPALYSTSGLSAAEQQAAITRGGQIFLTNCTACHNFTGEGGAMPQGGFAPTILHTDPKYIYEAMLTGPQSMDTFSNGNISPEEKRDVIAYIETMRHQTKYGGFALGSLGPVSEGLMAWVVGIGVMVGFAVWIAAHSTRSTKKVAKKGLAE